MYIRIKEVAQILGVGQSTIWYWIKKGEFPEAIKLSTRVSVWKKEEVKNWIDNKAA